MSMNRNCNRMRHSLINIWLLGLVMLTLVASCKGQDDIKVNRPELMNKEMTAKDILGNPKFQAIAYGGYREMTREKQPTIEDLKEDLKILHAMNIKVLKTFNVELAETSNLLKAIKSLMSEDKTFEMYVMLGAWISCENAWIPGVAPNHDKEDIKANTLEIERAIELANQYPSIVKVISVGNEAMVHWAERYYVQPDVVLSWVNHLQALKKMDKLPRDIWITCSDNFDAWGGGDSIYHVPALVDLIRAVDFVSMHTYPYHNTYYQPDFWGIQESEVALSDIQKIELAMRRAVEFAQVQYQAVATYIEKLGIEKPIHIGETGWATMSNGNYGSNGSKATDEFKQALYYKWVRDWTNDTGITCFYFEAFNERWKDAGNQGGSENHFGLFTVDGSAKYVLWDLVDQGVFDGLTRNGNPISKTYEGDIDALLRDVEMPAVKNIIAADL